MRFLAIPSPARQTGQAKRGPEAFSRIEFRTEPLIGVRFAKAFLSAGSVQGAASG